MQNPPSWPFSPSCHLLPPSPLSGSLIEGLKSPETSLLLPDLLTLADPLSSSAGSSTSGTRSVFVLCLALKFPVYSACVFLAFLLLFHSHGHAVKKQTLGELLKKAIYCIHTKAIYFLLSISAINVFVLLFFSIH